MRILHSQLEKLLVKTESGTELGKVTDVVYSTGTHSVVHYIVTAGLLRQTRYDVTPSQVLSITDTEMIVVDTLTPISKEEISDGLLPQANPAMMTESE